MRREKSKGSNLDGIGKRIAALRHQNKLSQAKLATHIGVAPSSVAFYELGTTRPGLESLIALADLFRTSTDSLLGRIPSGRGDYEEQAAVILHQLPPNRRELALNMLRALAKE